MLERTTTVSGQVRQLLIAVLLLSSGILSAQDIHYTMFERASANLNPALTGIFGGELRAAANYRSQWSNVPVSYQTFSALVEHKFFPNNTDKGYWAGGLYFNYDDAGNLTLALTQIGLSGSYTHALSAKNYLSGGLQAGFNQRRFNTQNITTDMQFNGDTFDPNAATGEDFLLDNVNYLNLSAGLNYRFQNIDADRNKRTRIDLGVALYHFNRPDKSFSENFEDQLESRLSLYANTSFAISSRFDVGVLGTYQRQTPHGQVVIGGNIRRYFKGDIALALGASMRLGDFDALVFPVLNLDYRNLSFGFSYDWNLSDFEVATNNQGAFEFSAIYTVGRPRIVEQKPCLIF